jgi:hypothetical protein
VRYNHIATGLIFTGSDFCEITINAFVSTHQCFGPEMAMFQGSIEFIAKFKSPVWIKDLEAEINGSGSVTR